MTSSRDFQKDTYHHLYNRGANKARIFYELKDYQFFQRRLIKYKQKYSIEILCYCLMTNHFHLFVKQTTAEKPINKFAGDLLNSYTKSINKKYKRSGVLFQGRTENKPVFDEKAFPVLAKYILLNPVYANLCKKFYDYEYSSAKELLGVAENNITELTILDYFKNREKFVEFINEEDRFDLIQTYLHD